MLLLAGLEGRSQLRLWACCDSGRLSLRTPEVAEPTFWQRCRSTRAADWRVFEPVEDLPPRAERSMATRQ